MRCAGCTFRASLRDAGNTETAILAVLEVIFDLVSKAGDLARQCIAVHLAQIFAPLVDAGSLERLPAALRAVIGEISGD